MRSVKDFCFFGFQGKLDQESYGSLAELHVNHGKPHRLEVSFDDMNGLSGEMCTFWENTVYALEKENQIVRMMASDAYNSITRYGFFGDVVRVRRYGDESASYRYVVDLSAQLAYDKPGIAADMLPFIRDIDGQMFFVCIRKEAVGQGPFALVGGFVDSSGMRMETFAEAAARESNEEVTMGISASGFGVPRMSVPYADDIPIIVEFRNGERVASSMKLVGSFFPSDSFRELAAGCKRVHLTTAYMTVVEIGRRLTCEEIEGFFMSGDDAKEVVVLAESDFDGAPFKEGHHRMIFDKARKLLG